MPLPVRMDRPRAGRRGARVQLPTVGSGQHAIAVSIAPVIQLSIQYYIVLAQVALHRYWHYSHQQWKFMVEMYVLARTEYRQSIGAKANMASFPLVSNHCRL